MKREIKLRIHEESDLFSPYDPDQMQLSEDMISYLKCKSEMMLKKYKEVYTLHIFSDTPVNEDKVRNAFREQLLLQLEDNRFSAKLEITKGLFLLFLGVVILSFRYILAERGEALYLDVMEIMGWVAIWEATSGALLRVPELYHKKKEHEFVSKADIIIEVTSASPFSGISAP